MGKYVQMKITKQKLKEIIEEEIKNTYAIMQEAAEEKEYPNKSTMKKLVLQTKRAKNPRKKVYKQTYNPDLEQLKKDFDALVRNTARDPLKKYTSRKGDKDE